jgi:hypothetical protein
VSRWLQTEPPVENTQLYKKSERGSVGHIGNQQREEGILHKSNLVSEKHIAYIFSVVE